MAVHFDGNGTADAAGGPGNRSCNSGIFQEYWSLEHVKYICVTIFLIGLNITVVFGNVLVLAATVVDRQLRSPTHHFIASLAAADLAVGVFVLPFAIVLQTHGVWTFGPTLCQLWLAVDVWLCTASIYSLIMVAVDRYVAVTRPLAYRSFMTHTRAAVMIALAWTVSLIICLPTFVVSSYRAYQAVNFTCQCTQMIHGAIYIVYSAVGSFYLPMAVIIYVYIRIYITVRRIRLQGIEGVVTIDLHSERFQATPSEVLEQTSSSAATEPGSVFISGQHVSLYRNGRHMSAVLRVHKGKYTNPNSPLISPKPPVRKAEPAGPLETLLLSQMQQRQVCNNNNHSLSLPIQDQNHLMVPDSPSATSGSLTPDSPSRFNRLESTASVHSFWMHCLAVPSQLTSMWCQRMDAFQKYQQKLASELGALRTVGIVTGCFLACWFGFCVVYTMHAWPSCHRHYEDASETICIPDWLISLMVWLGYANSGLNPIIYAVSNHNFRRAFRNILRCQCL